MSIKELKIQKAPKYLVKRTVITLDYNQFGELIGRRFTDNIMAITEEGQQAREIIKALRDADEFYEDDLPDNVGIEYSIEENISEVIEPITRFTNLDLCSAYADEIEDDEEGEC